MTVSLINMNSLSNLGDLTRKRVAVAAYYFVPGVVFASWASRIPDVKQMLHLSNGQLGSVLFAIPIGQLLMMAFSGVLVSRFGRKALMRNFLKILWRFPKNWKMFTAKLQMTTKSSIYRPPGTYIAVTPTRNI